MYTYKHTHMHMHTHQKQLHKIRNRLHPLKPDVLCGFKACMSAFQFFFPLFHLHGSELVARLPNPEFISSEKRFIQAIAIQGKMITEKLIRQEYGFG